MKCRTCGDSGTIVTVDPISGKKYETKCPLCVAERKMTNEEWLNSLNTEQKAKWLSRYMGICSVCENADKFDDDACCENGICPYGEDNRKAFEMWLRQEHKE